MSVNLETPIDAEGMIASNDGAVVSIPTVGKVTLGSLPVGSRLILRSRKDWRTATVAAVTIENILLTVASPSGFTYRMRRPHETPLVLDGSIPLLGEGGWRVGMARYDKRW